MDNHADPEVGRSRRNPSIMTTAIDHKAGDVFTWKPGQRKSVTVQDVRELKKDTFEGPAEFIGQLLFVLTYCRTLVLPPSTPVKILNR